MRVMDAVDFLRWIYHKIKTPRDIVYDNIVERIVLIGNGPSASDFPYEKFIKKGYELCCVNLFPINSSLFFELKPKYYCCLDPYVFMDDYWNSIDGKRLLDVFSRINWELTVITTNRNTIPVDNNMIKYHYINNNIYGGEINSFKAHLFANNVATCGYQNVIVGALYYFILRSCKRIVLTGVENDWHKELFVDKNNDVLREDTHFYGKTIINVTQKGEIGKGELYKYFLFYYTTLFEYRVLSEFAKYNDAKVINTCEDSYIDVFEKKNLLEVLLDE